MADYFSQTVIRPDIPRTAMTALEYKVLGQIFDHEDVGDDVYFCAGHGPNDLLFLDLAEVKALLTEDDGVASGLADLVRQEIAKCDADDAERSEEHTSELQSLMRISYAVFCLKQKKKYKDK